ncbi:MAG: hypothetical protein PHN82_09730 [bacterium]|nr:hypothetical protein [bacterium]
MTARRLVIALLLSAAAASHAAASSGADEPRPPAAVGADGPSDIERRVARAIAFAYLHRAEDLEEEYLYFKTMDAFLREQGQPTTGLGDNLLDLMVSTIEDRDEYMTAQRHLLGEARDGTLRERVAYRLSDEVRTADSLIRTDRYNRFAFIFNTFVRPLSLLSVGYFPALIDAGVATALNVNRLTELSVRERKALDLYNRFLERYPDSDGAEILRRKVTGLDRKRIAACHDGEVAAAREHLAREEFWQAQQRFKNALAYMPASRGAAEGLARARQLEAERNRLRERSLRPAADTLPPPTPEEERRYEKVLYAAARAVPEEMIDEAEGFLERHPHSRYAPTARYAIAVAHDMKGAHEKAKDLMGAIAREHRGTLVAGRCEAYLADPAYNLRSAFAQSRAAHGRRTARFVVLGEEFVKSNIILSTSRLITQGLHAVQSLGTFNVMAMAIRGANTFIGNPVSDQEVIDAGVSYLRRHPDSPGARDVHAVLAKAYARRQNLAKALYHYEASGTLSERRLAGLREKAARQYLDFASATESREEKIRCCESILDEYPRTKAALKALEMLAVLEKSGDPLFELDREAIAANPVIYRVVGSPLGPHLLDGDPDNGEIADRGVYSPRRGAVTIVLAGGREETFEIEAAAYRSLAAIAEEHAYRKRLAGGDERAPGGAVPVELRGTVSSAGVYVYPRLKVREYQEKDLYLYR